MNTSKKTETSRSLNQELMTREAAKEWKADPAKLQRAKHLEEQHDVAIEMLTDARSPTFKVWRAQKWLFTAPTLDQVAALLDYERIAHGGPLICSNTLAIASQVDADLAGAPTDLAELGRIAAIAQDAYCYFEHAAGRDNWFSSPGSEMLPSVAAANGRAKAKELGLTVRLPNAKGTLEQRQAGYRKLALLVERWALARGIDARSGQVQS